MSNLISKFGHRIVREFFFLKKETNITGSKIIIHELLLEKPSMIARFGSTEIKAVLYPKAKVPFKKLLRKLMNYNISEEEFVNMKILSGFFPSNKQTITQFSELMHEDMKELDILGSWRFEERFLRKNFKTAKIISLDQLEPYLMIDPWSKYLENKKVLVIHPFNKTIENQYHNKRQLLFKNKDVLPNFKSLETIKAVQTLAGNSSKFKDWFDALEYMKKEIDSKDFDIAIIGAGAYGFPLAAHIKRLGKKAIHMGGPTQMLFGIKGKRWIDNPKFKDIINEHFVFPSDEDKIQNATKVEDGCYW